MSNKFITAPDSSTVATDKKSITATNNGDESKRGLDTYLLGGSITVSNTPHVIVDSGAVNNTPTYARIGATISGSIVDAVVIADPTATTRTFTYKTGGVSGTTLKTITVTYASASLKPTLDITQVVAT